MVIGLKVLVIEKNKIMNEKFVQLQLDLLKDKVDKLESLFSKKEIQVVNPILLNPKNNQWWVFKKKNNNKEFIKVGTADFHQKENVVIIEFLDTYKKEYIENPSLYEYGFWTMTDYGGSNYLGYKKNLLEKYRFKYNFTEIEGSHGVTGYLTNDGKVIYYDQYL